LSAGDIRIAGAVVLTFDVHRDVRGSFSRAYSHERLSEAGVDAPILQTNVAMTFEQGTVRGLHYQRPPDAEFKIIRCIRGAIWDVVVDLRPDSATYLKYMASKLTEDNGRAVVVPELCAHGYQTLTADAIAVYGVTAEYSPASERGVRFDDPTLGIAWPLPITQVSEKDASWPELAAPDHASVEAGTPTRPR